MFHVLCVFLDLYKIEIQGNITKKEKMEHIRELWDALKAWTPADGAFILPTVVLLYKAGCLLLETVMKK